VVRVWEGVAAAAETGGTWGGAKKAGVRKNVKGIVWRNGWEEGTT